MQADSDPRSDRWLPLGGILFLILGGLGAVIYGETPDFVGSPEAISAFYEAESDPVTVGNVLYLFGGAFLLVFVAALRAGLERVAGPTSPQATLALIGGVAGTAMMIGAASIDLVAALRVDEQGSIDPATATVLWDVSGVLFGLAAGFGWGVALLAAASVALRRDALPAWLGVLSAIWGIVLLIPPISWVAMVSLGLPTAAWGIVLYLRWERLRPPAIA